MAINIKFDLAGNPEPPTIILANRNGNKLGQLDVNVESIDISDKFNDASEFSFTLNKYRDEEITNLWDKVVDFKLVYCKEWDMWFEIKVELDETTETIKTVFCTQLGQAELSQIMLYNIQINTEEDIARDDYKITILYDEKDPEASLLNRLLKDKAPHYSIIHVDSTIANIQRTFSFDGTSIYDALQEVAEEIGCLFIYNSNSDEKGKIQRTISVYDLQQNCLDCGHRGEYTDVCPKCGSTNIKYGYGEDTLIFVTSDELASDGIQLVTDVDSVKNCFKLEAGDDLMTATVRNCNPNGTDYIWYFSDDIKEDMSDELVNKIESYNVEYKKHYNESEINIDEDLLNSYNELINKYSVYNEDLQKISTPIKGYSNLMNAYYNVIDLALYLKSGLMPSVEMSETNAEEQASLLTTSSLSPVAVTDVTIASLSTINSAVLAMAKVIIKSTYKVQINTSELIEEGNGRYWSGNFIITNYSDEEDTAVSNIIIVAVNDDLETFTKQKIDKALNKENTDDLSISGLFKKEVVVIETEEGKVFSGDFCEELKKYALNPLISFHDACQTCIDILIEQGVSDNDTWADDDEGAESNLYERLYMPYYNKLMAIEIEMKLREDEINIISGVYDLDGGLVTEGLQTYIEEYKTNIQKILDFESYLGNELLLEFCAYRREDKYSNENYISDGLNNAELFKKALEFFEVAENEIYKSAELQHSISTTLNNLLAIEKFKPLVESFSVGNWIRVKVDGRVYKLRLLEYGIDYGDFNNVSVEFSDVAKIKNGITDVQDILEQASSMATSYNDTQKQASQGKESNDKLNGWVNDGLALTNMKIVGNADNQNVTWDSHGILCREYLPITDKYDDRQIKIINRGLYVTNDNWLTSKAGIGNFMFYNPETKQTEEAYGVIADTLVGNLILSEKVGIYNAESSVVIDNHGISIVSDNTEDENLTTFTISKKTLDENGNEMMIPMFYVDSDGELVLNGSIKIISSINTDISSINDICDNNRIFEKVNKTIDDKMITVYSSIDEKYQDVLNETITQLNNYKAEVGQYLTFGADGLSIGAKQYDESGNLKYESPFKTVIDNQRLAFKNSNTTVAYISGTQLNILNAIIRNSLVLGNFFLSPRPDKGVSITWQDDINVDDISEENNE